MNGVASPKLADLEEAFQCSEDVEDCWKLGLCYLVEALSLADEPWRRSIFTSYHMLRRMIFFFFQYHWSMDSYHKTLKGVDKDIVHY